MPFACFQIRLRVVVGAVEAHVAKPIADDRDVDACRDEVHCMAEAVRCYMLRLQRWLGFSHRLHIGGKLESDARGAEWLTKAVDEQPLVWCSRLPVKQLFQQHQGFRLERADTFLAAFARKTNTTWAIEPDRSRDTYSVPPVSVPRCYRGTRVAQGRACLRGRTCAWRKIWGPRLPWGSHASVRKPTSNHDV